MNTIKTNNRIFYFKRWSRRSWAAFASMGRQIAISTLALSLTAVTFQGRAQQQEPLTESGDSIHRLEEVEVTGELCPEVYADMSRMVEMIMPSQLRNAPALSLNDIINSASFADVRQRGPAGVQADLSFRGSGFEQVLLLIDGIPVNNPQTGHHNLDALLPEQAVERIEMLTGAAARIYGPNAYAGAVNIVTLQGSDDKILEVGAGDYGYRKAALSAQWGSRKSRQGLYAQYTSSSGYAANTDFNDVRAFYSYLKPFKKASLHITGSLTGRKFGAQSFYTPRFPWQYESTGSFFASGEYRSYGKVKNTVRLYYQLHSDRFELFRQGVVEAPAWYGGPNYHQTRVTGLQYRSSFNSTPGRSTLGLDLRREALLSNVLGINLGDTLYSRLLHGAYYTAADRRILLSLFGEQAFSIGPWRLSAGLLLHEYQGLRLYPGLDISRRLAKQGRLFLSLNSALREPSFTEMYYRGPANIGNSALLPEESINLALGLSKTSRAFRLQGEMFISKGYHSIDWVRKADSLPWQAMNISQTLSYGINGSMRYAPEKKQAPQLTLGWLINQKHYDALGMQSAYVDDYLRYKITFSVQEQIVENLSFYAQADLRQRHGFYPRYNPADGTESMQAYGQGFALNIKLKYRLRAFELYLQISNLTNSSMPDYGNIPTPGRWATGGVKYHLP